SGHIQQLMKEPVLQDKRSEHVKFCKFAAELMERISGKPLLIGTDVSLAWLQRASVVAQSKIAFPEKELLLLIRNHLVAKGLHDTANTLTKEADLPMTCLSHSSHCSHSASSFPAVAPPPPASPVTTLPRTPRLANGVGSRHGNHPSHSSAPPSSHPQPRPCTTQSAGPASSAVPSTSTPHCNNGSPLIGRIVFSRDRQTPCGAVNCKKNRVLRQKSDHGAFSQSPAMKKQFDKHLPSPPALDGIITEYLREQHARCKNPVATCPPFSLFTPHQCPEPKQRRQAPVNFTSRHSRRVIYPKYGGVDGGCFDRHLIFSRLVSFLLPSGLSSISHLYILSFVLFLSRFRPISVFREADEDESGFMCCAFSARERFLMLGTCTGQLKLYNVFTGQEEASYSCHSSAITNLEPSRIYDIQTGQVTLTLNNPDLANNYKRNCATFNPTDDLVLNDGVLWDVRTAQAIHKFDKFNMNISGVFHPNGQEVIINTEIVSFRH
ncbi:DDB1- and CUL4-associated factor 1, partial [Goodea atripinnis]